MERISRRTRRTSHTTLSAATARSTEIRGQAETNNSWARRLVFAGALLAAAAGVSAGVGLEAYVTVITAAVSAGIQFINLSELNFGKRATKKFSVVSDFEHLTEGYWRVRRRLPHLTLDEADKDLDSLAETRDAINRKHAEGRVGAQGPILALPPTDLGPGESMTRTQAEP
jgi:hypothetical protein